MVVPARQRHLRDAVGARPGRACWKSAFLGGTSTAVLDIVGILPAGKTNRKIIGGIPDQLVAELGRICPVIERPNTFEPAPASRIIPTHSRSRGNGWSAPRACCCTRLSRMWCARRARLDALVVATKAAGLQLVRGSVVIDVGRRRRLRVRWSAV